jgi:hypothetical protein
MDIESSMSKNQYYYKQLCCALIPCEAELRICRNMPRGLVSESEPLGLLPVGLEDLLDAY